MEHGEGLMAVGVSAEWKKTMGCALRVAGTTFPVLLLGETGSGKEVVAQAIHRASGRAGPFVPVRCPAIPADLLESELFGHRKGSYTGSIQDQVGLLEAAAGGTLLLDEIGELPEGLQAKLLGVLGSGKFRRLGNNVEVDLKAQVIAATNRDVRSSDAFRRDLYYRLSTFEIEVPPLRERPDDILPLAEHFGALAGVPTPKPLSAKAEERLVAHHWPGNVRELANVTYRFQVLSENDVIDASDLDLCVEPRALTSSGRSGSRFGQSLREVADQTQREHISATIEACEGNMTEAARLLGLPRRTLYRKMRTLGVSHH